MLLQRIELVYFALGERLGAVRNRCERSLKEATYDAHICCDKATQPDPEAKGQETNRPAERSQERAAHARGERQREQRDKRRDTAPEIQAEAALARVRGGDKSQDED